MSGYYARNGIVYDGGDVNIALCLSPEDAQRIAAALNQQAGVVEALLREAFAHGNQRGHERTVEGYWSPEIDDDFSEWLQDTPAALAAVKGVKP